MLYTDFTELRYDNGRQEAHLCLSSVMTARWPSDGPFLPDEHDQILGLEILPQIFPVSNTLYAGVSNRLNALALMISKIKDRGPGEVRMWRARRPKVRRQGALWASRLSN